LAKLIYEPSAAKTTQEILIKIYKSLKVCNMRLALSFQYVLGFLPLAACILSPLPPGYEKPTSKWAFLSYKNPSLAVLPGHFNRSVFVPFTDSQVSDPSIAKE
jgi:gluconolactonase